MEAAQGNGFTVRGRPRRVRDGKRDRVFAQAVGKRTVTMGGGFENRVLGIYIPETGYGLGS